MLRITDIRHVTYQQNDLDAVERFYTDFGLVTAGRTDTHLYMRGAGTAPFVYVAELAERPCFVGLAFEVETYEDLKWAAEQPGATAITDLDAPGGGKQVSLFDPDGYRVDLVCAAECVESHPLRAPIVLNTGDSKVRKGEYQRMTRAAAQVLRLGHVALNVSNFSCSLDWYTNTLGLIASDLFFDGARENLVGGFLRRNRGEEWVDHHTVALFQTPSVHIHHASFEVQDFDAQQLGHDWLAKQGWKPYWGLGRHVIGSQIFDYWRDPGSQLVEHFTDSDLCQSNIPTNYHQVADDMLYQWGPQVPADFLD